MVELVFQNAVEASLSSAFLQLQLQTALEFFLALTMLAGAYALRLIAHLSVASHP